MSKSYSEISFPLDFIFLYMTVQRLINIVLLNILGISGNSTDSEGNLNISLGTMTNVDCGGSISSDAILENIHPPANQLRQTWLLLKRNFLSARRNYVTITFYIYKYLINSLQTFLYPFFLLLQHFFHLTTLFLLIIIVMYLFPEFNDVEILGSYFHCISFWILIQRCWE